MVPLKVRDFVWMLVLMRINTNAILQKQRPGLVISPYICMLSQVYKDSRSHVFLQCEVITYL